MRTNLRFFDSRDGLDIFALLAQAFTTPARPRDLHAGPREGLLERLDRWLSQSNQRRLEAYLAKSTDLHDLEARLRAFERGEAWRGFPEH